MKSLSEYSVVIREKHTDTSKDPGWIEREDGLQERYSSGSREQGPLGVP